MLLVGLFLILTINMSVSTNNGSTNDIILSNSFVIGKKQGDYQVPFCLSFSDAKIGNFSFRNKENVFCSPNYLFINARTSAGLCTFGYMIFRIILIAIILILIVRFIIRFVLPVFQITSMTQEKLRRMQEEMERSQQQQQAKQSPRNNVKEGDYIDYEEVK